MSLKKIVISNTLYQLLGRAGALLFSVASTSILRRFFGRSGFGDFVFITSYALIFVNFVDFGTHLITVREVAKNKKWRAKILGNTLILRSFFACLSLPLSFLILMLLKSNHLPFSYFLGLFLILSISFKSSLTVIFHSILRLEFSGLLDILSSFVIFLAAFLTIILKRDLAFLIFFILFFQGSACLLFFLKARKLVKISFDFNLPIIKKIFSESLPLGAILILFTLYSKTSILLLKVFKGSEVVGVFGLSQKAYDNLTLPAAFLMNALLPAVSKVSTFPKKGSKEEFKKIFKNVFLILFSASIFLAVMIFVFADLIVLILAGVKAKEEILALKLLSPALIFAFLNHLLGYSIIALGEQRKSFYIYLLALAINFSANILLIPIYSYKAAAANTILTEAIVALLSGVVVYRKVISK